jgi:hypothetical protein
MGGDDPELPPEQIPEDRSAPEPEPLPPASPAGTSITINGRSFTVDPELASALEGREQDFNRRLSEQGREVGELRRWQRQMERPPAAPQPQADSYNYGVRIFEAPEEALMRVKREAIEEATSQLTSRYRAEREQEQHWGRFYKDNPDLADEQRLVRAIAGELLQQPEWADSQDMRGFFAELAKEAKGELLRISRRGREADAPAETLPQARRPVEGGRRAAAPQQPQARAQPMTMSQWIERRRQARQRAGRQAE